MRRHPFPRAALSAYLILGSFLMSLSGCEEQETLLAPLEPIPSPQPIPDVGDQPKDQPQAVSEADRVWWRSLTQAQRNSAIACRGELDIGRYVGQNCKEWTRTAVLGASHGVVSLPQTLPDAYGWYWAYSPYLVGMSGGIRSVQRGWMVQMRWRKNNGAITPHTFIIRSRDASGISVVECNWTPLTVTTRWISFSEFESRVTNYSCHYAIGG